MACPFGKSYINEWGCQSCEFGCTEYTIKEKIDSKTKKKIEKCWKKLAEEIIEERFGNKNGK
jgi:uncharacterized protein YutD